MKKISIILICLSFFFISCSNQIKEVYIPVRCNTPEHIKPKRNDYVDYTEFHVKLRAYYKAIENDLHFCRTGKRILKPP